MSHHVLTSEPLFPASLPWATSGVYSAWLPSGYRSTGGSLVGCLPMETPQCCWVIPVVFSHACPGSPKAGRNLLSPLLMIMSANLLNHCTMGAGLMLFWYWWLDSTERETQGYLEGACLAWVTVVSNPQTPSADAPSLSACSTKRYWTTLSAHLNKSSMMGEIQKPWKCQPVKVL